MMQNNKEIDEILRREDLKNIEASGFQKVVSRSTKKKSLKPVATNSRSQHTTRSKTGNTKPFK